MIGKKNLTLNHMMNPNVPFNLYSTMLELFPHIHPLITIYPKEKLIRRL